MRQENGTTAAPPAPDSMARALEEYLAAAEAGTAPPRDEFLARYPQLAEDLDACLAALRFIGRAAGQPGMSAPGLKLAAITAAPPLEQAPGQLGDFRIIREVGRGGMGVVYEAEQVSLGRRVALKVLLFAATMDPRQLQRFHNEVRAAASLDHPHIVHVHAVGCERAVHFYAMQFIEGQTLAAMIADLRQASGWPVAPDAQPTTPQIPEAPAPDTAPRAAASTERVPRDRAHFRLVAELGIQAAEALDHAHTLGIVHRDVKPANLLVDGRGNLWVTDFGLAHIQSDARLTMTGDLVGTLRYMSPEQALAKRMVVDHRTDVYSLGATLYELLTLEPVFGGGDRQELLRQIAFEEPRPPRRIHKAIPTELETIVQKAMEKNPADRYATAKELADDLRRFLADEPILARPVGVARRLRKWGRRHPAWVSAAAALVLTVLVLGGVALWRELAQRAAVEDAVKVALERAEWLQQQDRWDEALAVLAGSLEQLKGRGLEALRQRVEQSRRDVAMLLKLEEARLQQAAGSKEAAFDYAGADRLYAGAFEGYGLDVSALSHKEAAERVRTSLICNRLIAGLDNWAHVRDELNQKDGGPLRAVADLADDDPWRRRLREAVWRRRDLASLKGLAEDKGVLSQPPINLELLAWALRITGKQAIAERLLRQAQAARPADFWINFALAQSLNQKKSANNAEAIRFYQAALALRPHSAVVYNNLGAALGALGKLAEAEAACREALRINKDYPTAHVNLGNALREKGDLDGAIAELRAAIDLDPKRAQAHYNLGNALRDKGNLVRAIAEWREAINLNKDYAEAHDNLGAALREKGDFDGAIAEAREALRINKDYPTAHYNLGSAMQDKGDLDAAIVEFREALRINNDFDMAHCNLGLALRGKGHFAKALTHLRRGHELGSKDPRWHYPSAQWVKQCERLVKLDAKLPAILSGKEQPANGRERFECAQVCQMKHLYASAARLYREAIMAQPALVASPGNGIRYNAACAAALASCGAGEDVPKLTEAERAGFRKQALDWLRADLDAWRRLLDRAPAKAPPVAAQKMRHWLRDADFNGVRGPDALGKLPEAERKEWQKLWADVAATWAWAKGTAKEK